MSATRTFSRRQLMTAALALSATGLAGQAQAQAQAQAWPSTPIRIVVGFPAGSSTDSVARVLAEHLRAKLGQTVIVENKPGANGVLGVTEVARAPADGYTILATNSSSMTVNPQVYRKISYKLADFAPVSMVVSAPFVLTVNATGERTSAVNTVADLVALARALPGELTYSSGGPGNLAHLGFEMINNRAAIKTIHVPYKGGAAAQIGLLGKEVDAQLDTPIAVPHVKTGRLKALAVTTAKRWPDLPTVPTMIEAGYPGFDVSFWLGVLVPAQTPPAVILALSNAIRSVREDANAMKILQIQGTVELNDPAAFTAQIRAETASWGEVIRRENIQVD